MEVISPRDEAALAGPKEGDEVVGHVEPLWKDVVRHQRWVFLTGCLYQVIRSDFQIRLLAIGQDRTNEELTHL